MAQFRLLAQGLGDRLPAGSPVLIMCAVRRVKVVTGEWVCHQSRVSAPGARAWIQQDALVISHHLCVIIILCIWGFLIYKPFKVCFGKG